MSSLVSLAVANTCSKVQACSVQLSRYPVLEEVGLQVAGSPQQSIAQEASGWGSGMVPLYDELMDEQTSVDYTASPEISTWVLLNFLEAGCFDRILCWKVVEKLKNKSQVVSSLVWHNSFVFFFQFA